MATNKLAVSGRRKTAAHRQKQTTLLPEGDKYTVALKPEEIALSRSLARVIAQPGQVLTIQDVLRIGLANLGIARKKDLEIGTNQKAV